LTWGDGQINIWRLSLTDGEAVCCAKAKLSCQQLRPVLTLDALLLFETDHADSNWEGSGVLLKDLMSTASTTSTAPVAPAAWFSIADYFAKLSNISKDKISIIDVLFLDDTSYETGSFVTAVLADKFCLMELEQNADFRLRFHGNWQTLERKDKWVNE
jgi:hypothetical protein